MNVIKDKIVNDMDALFQNGANGMTTEEGNTKLANMTDDALNEVRL